MSSLLLTAAQMYENFPGLINGICIGLIFSAVLVSYTWLKNTKIQNSPRERGTNKDDGETTSEENDDDSTNLNSADNESIEKKFTDTYFKHVNPRWVDFMNIIGFNLEYTKCIGSELYTADGRRILDFVSSYSVQNTGHNHPYIIDALTTELCNNRPAILHCCHVPEIAGDLAQRLTALAGNGLNKVLYVNSGSEGIETAIKFSRATTKRNGIIHVKTAFHGLTCGALSLSTTPFWYEQFGPLLKDVISVTLDDIEELEFELASKKYAAFVIEPLLAEAGLVTPCREYLQKAQQLCHRYGTVFVMDEVQTGVFRTGTFLLFQQFDLKPDIVVMAKALSGGVMPVGAVLMTDAVYNKTIKNVKKSFVQFSTFGENKLSMRAGIATLEVIHKENLAERAIYLGNWMRSELTERLKACSIVKEVRGIGLLCGIEFAYPLDWSASSLYFQAVGAVNKQILATIVTVKLFRERNILTQVCANNLMVLKLSPPLTTSDEQMREFLDAMVATVESIQNSNALVDEFYGIAMKAMQNH